MKSSVNSVSRIAIGFALLTAAPAFAQETVNADAGRGASEDEIVVTALRREQALQDVPVSVTVIGSQQIANQGINDFNDLSLRIPNVQIFENSNLSGRTSVTIRGVPGRAGIYVDDVFVGDGSGINTLLVDVDRVEVLRGPQGTLFGRNAVSGAINTITRRPGKEFFAQGKVRYGSYDSVYAAGAVGGPLVGDLSGKISGAYRKNNGFDRLVTGERVNGDDSYAFQGQLRYNSGEGTDIWISADYQKDDARNGYTDAFADFSLNGAPGPLYLNAQRDGDPFDRVLPVRDAENREQREVKGISGHIDLDLGGVSFSSITAYREIDFLFNRDGDGSSFDLLRGVQPVNYHQFSQEIRLLSPSGGIFEWQVGAYYFKDRRRSEDTNFIGSDFPLTVNPGLAPFAPALVPGGVPGVVTLGRLASSPILQAILRPIPDPTLQAIFALGLPSNGGQQTTYDSNRIESYSGFASVTFRPIEMIEITAGARYTHETVKASYGRTSSGVVGLLTPTIAEQFLDNGGDNDFSPSASISYKPTDNITAYVSYSTGFRSGGFNTAPAALVPPPNDAELRTFRPETVTSYEVGLKTSLLDNRLTANIAVFTSDYKDFQRSFYNITSTGVVTVQTFNTSASMKGFEIELFAQPSDNFTVSANYGYQDSAYDDYPNAVVSSYLVTGSPLTIDLTGQPLPFVPKHSLSVGAEFTYPISDNLALGLGGDIQLRSQYNIADGVDLIRQVSSVTQLGLHAGIGDPDGTWQIGGRVYNLTNEVYRTGLDYNSFVGTVYQSLSAPRTFVVEASFKF